MTSQGRLRKGEEFDGVFKEGSVVAGPFFVLRHRPNAGTAPRWGLAVGKRLAKSSVDRNVVRRRLREAIRAIDGVHAADIVITARQPALRAGTAQLRQALVIMLRRAGLLEGESQ